MKTELLMFWIAVGMYGLSSFSYIFGMISTSNKLFTAGLSSAVVGFICHTLSIGIRWSHTSITPFIDVAESLTLGTFMAVLVYLVTEFSLKKLKPLGVLVMPTVFALLGWGGTLLKDVAQTIAPSLQSGWIWIHIVGATSGFASVLIAAGLGLLYLLKERKSDGVYSWIPDLESLDLYSYRYVAGGFIMYGLMIVSGCFWANQVKGSYWNWDPVEVWSLVSWLTYGIYLHLRVTFGWRGRKLAWYSLIALIAMIISYWGIPFSVETFHSGFRIDHN